MSEGEIKIFRVTNPRWLGYLAKGLQTLAEKINDPTITYETLYTYFCNSIQYGGDNSELWVVQSGEEVYGYAHFLAKPLPQRSVVCCDYIHSFRNRSTVVGMLVDKFVKFGNKKRCDIYEGTAISESTLRIFNNQAKKLGYSLEPTNKTTFLCKKK